MAKMGRFFIGIVLGLLVLAQSGIGAAEVKAGSFTVTPMFGVYAFEGDQDLDSAPTYGLGLGYNFTKNWAAEFLFNYINTSSQAGAGDVDGTLYRLDGLYHFRPESKLAPYVAAGIGSLNLDPDIGGDTTDMVFNYGAGLKYFFTDAIALRADLRHLVAFGDPENNLAFTVGLTFSFGGEKKKVVPPPPPAPCPDSDKDGVCDDQDKCPGTPAGVKVDSRGCCLDSDSDGVCDYKDKCPGTPAGAKVDENGCPIILKEKVSIELRVEFDFDQAVVKPQYYDEIKKVADFMKAYIYTKAVLEGHTDSMGSDKYNQKLSQKRAEAVKQCLIDKFGVAPERLSAVGYGESRPIADNNTDEGRQRNRRVVAVISAIEERMKMKK